MLNFDFAEKILGLVSRAHFVYGFSRKMFLMLHSINLPKLIAYCLYFLRYWTLCILQLFANEAKTS